MSKLSYEDKINLYKDRKKGLSKKSVSIKYNISIHGAQYLCCLIDKHGFDILRKNKNNKYSNEFKLEAINRCLNNNESVLEIKRL